MCFRLLLQQRLLHLIIGIIVWKVHRLLRSPGIRRGSMANEKRLMAQHHKRLEIATNTLNGNDLRLSVHRLRSRRNPIIITNGNARDRTLITMEVSQVLHHLQRMFHSYSHNRNNSIVHLVIIIINHIRT